MSIRFHKGAALLTILSVHYPSRYSSQSLRVSLTSSLSKLSPFPHSHDPTSTISLQALKLLRQAQSQSSSSASSPSSSDSPAPIANDSPSSAYLKEASSPPLSTNLDLEILDRKKFPPTNDQMVSIMSYLSNGTNDQISKEQLQEGPLVVFWDAGLAANTLKGTEELLKNVKEERNFGGKSQDGSYCAVM